MGKSESQMDIVEKSTRPGQKSWNFVTIGLTVLLILMTCAVVVLLILHSSSRGTSIYLNRLCIFKLKKYILTREEFRNEGKNP
uniref:Uncharacterized protein n=1 Tax=Sphaerodactylus townsendi TaxID=933632 RepID=A0ACB8EEA9_9SAUR